MEVLPFCSCCHCVRKPHGRRGAAAPGIVTDPINQIFSCCIAFPLHHICPVLFLCYTHLMTEVEMGLLCSWWRGNQCSLFTIRGANYCLAMPEHSVAAGSWNITPLKCQAAPTATKGADIPEWYFGDVLYPKCTEQSAEGREEHRNLSHWNRT